MRHKHARDNRRRKLKRSKKAAKIWKETHCGMCGTHCDRDEIATYGNEGNGKLLHLCNLCDVTYIAYGTFKETGKIGTDLFYHAVRSDGQWEEFEKGKPYPLLRRSETAAIMEAVSKVYDPMLRFAQQAWLDAGLGKKVHASSEETLLITDHVHQMVIFADVDDTQCMVISISNYDDRKDDEEEEEEDWPAVTLTIRPATDGEHTIMIGLEDIEGTPQQVIQMIEWATAVAPNLSLEAA